MHNNLKSFVKTDQGIVRMCLWQSGQESPCVRNANKVTGCTSCDKDDCNGEEAPPAEGTPGPTASQTTAAPTTAAPTATAGTTAGTKAKAGSTAAALKASKLVAIWTPVVGALIAILFMYV